MNTQPIYWSVRRELWENRSIYIAPVAVAALPPSRGAWALVCADFRMAAAGLSVGAARGISMGRVTSARNRGRREDCLQHFAFRRHAGEPLQRRRGRCCLHRGQHVDGCAHGGTPPERSQFLGRAGVRRGMPRGSSAAAPQSGTDLTNV